MIATLFFLLFMIFVPKKFKKIGIKLIIEQKKQGLLLFLLSKILWWFMFLQIYMIWLPDYLLFAYIAIAIGVSYKMYQERKYLAIGFTKKPSL